MLGVPGADAAAEAVRVLEERAGDALEGVLVERMIEGNREFLVGLKRDPVFGPVVAFGLGGVLTEVLDDVALAVAPLSEREVAVVTRAHQGREAPRSVPGRPRGGCHRPAAIISAVAQIAQDFPRSPRSTSTPCSSTAAAGGGRRPGHP